MRKSLQILLLTLVIFAAFPAPEAQAFDPVTMMVLMPVAIQAFQSAKPFIFRAASNTLKGFRKVIIDVFHIFYLPYGLVKMMVGIPWGGFRSGLVYTIRGAIAPCKLVLHTLMLPVYMCGISANI